MLASAAAYFAFSARCLCLLPWALLRLPGTTADLFALAPRRCDLRIYRWARYGIKSRMFRYSDPFEPTPIMLPFTL